MNDRVNLVSTAVAAGLVWLLGGPSAFAAATPADPLAAAPSHDAAFGTNRVHYLTLGQGRTTIVWVHCWAGRAEFWRAQVPAFQDHARLVLVDLPGHGRSDKPRVDYSMDYFAQAVLAVMADAKVDRAILVGHSMGVPVICRVYARAPEKVTGLVAVDGLLRRPSLQAEAIEQFIGPFRTPEYREHTTKFISSMFPIAGTEAVRDRVLADVLETPQYVMLGAMEGMFGTGRPAWDLDKIEVPVLVINARNPIWTADYETYVRALSPRVDYRTVDGVGHWLMLEKPAEFNAVLLELLRKYGLLSK
jgi:pimeloyl-ACP methyl ester carboxylesterase